LWVFNQIYNYSFYRKLYICMLLKRSSVTMAKPIRATPELSGKEAVAFLKNIAANQKAKATKRDKELLQQLEEFAW